MLMARGKLDCYPFNIDRTITEILYLNILVINVLAFHFFRPHPSDI